MNAVTQIDLAIINGLIFDGVEPSLRRGSVLVDGGRIQGVAEADASLPRANRTIDAQGRVVMPGLIDCHDHQTYHNTFGPLPSQWRLSRDTLIMRSVIAGCDALRHGVTTIREMGACGATNLSMQQAQREGAVVGPRIFACGMPLAISGGHAYEICRQADGIDEVRRTARQQIRGGATFVKLMASNEQPISGQVEQTVPQYSLDELRAAVDEAHDAGLLACVHVCGARAIERCLDAGVDSIEHGIYLNRDLAQRMKQQRVFYTPTLGIYRANTDPRWQRGSAKASFCRQLVEDHRRSFAIAVEVGLRWTVGTDAIVPLAAEMQYLVDAGLNRATVLSATVRTNAELLQREGELGVLQAGALADIVIMDGNPLEDFSALSRVRTIVQGGIVFEPEQLLPMLPPSDPPGLADNLR